jgi:type III secretion protein R
VKGALSVAAVLAWAPTVAAQPAPDAGGSGLSLTTLLALGALSLVPFFLMATTSFVKLSIVFTVLRNALGTGQVPSGAIITAFAAILTAYVMAPVAAQVAEVTAEPASAVDLEAPLSSDSRAALWTSVDRGKEPVRDFLRRNSGERERQLFLGLARRARPDDPLEVQETDVLVVAPAFLITELKEAFQIGFFVLLPFLVVDLVVANILTALGMVMLSPSTVALPLKLLLFVLVDGWYVLSEALILGYA